MLILTRAAFLYGSDAVLTEAAEWILETALLGGPGAEFDVAAAGATFEGEAVWKNELELWIYSVSNAGQSGLFQLLSFVYLQQQDDS